MSIDKQLTKAFHALQLGNLTGAESLAKGVLSIDQENPGALSALGKIALLNKRPAIAIEYLAKLNRICNQHPPLPVYLDFAHAYTELTDYDEAIEILTQAHNDFPEEPSPLNQIASLQLALGETSQAIEYFQRALKLKCNDITALRGLAELISFQADSNEYTQLTTRLHTEKDYKIKALILYTLSKIHKKNGDDDRFEHFLARAIHEQATDLQPNAAYQHYQTLHQAIIAAQSPTLFHQITNLATGPLKLIFVLGMPRSGTSLMERVLGAHPSVACGGELDYFRNPIATEYFARTGARFPEGVEKLDSAESNWLADKYLSRAQCIAKGKPILIDKTPGNFHILGHLIKLFPDCKVIHMTRHPLDICMSILQQPFNENSPHTYNFRLLAQNYAHYLQVMKNWKELLGDRFLTVEYESLVTDPLQHFEQVFNYCNLKWDAGYLNDDSKKRATFTFSASQVRRKISTASIGQWRKHEAFLKPLIDALVNHGVDIK